MPSILYLLCFHPTPTSGHLPPSVIHFARPVWTRDFLLDRWALQERIMTIMSTNRKSWPERTSYTRGRTLCRRLQGWKRSILQQTRYFRRRRAWKRKCAEKQSTGKRLCPSRTRAGLYSASVKMLAMCPSVCAMVYLRVSVLL